jgi:hypothetical protein
MLTADQIRNAPLEVRNWMKSLIDVELSLTGSSNHLAQSHEAPLTACTPEEAVTIFAHIRDDYATAQVLLELGRHVPVRAAGSHGIVGVALSDLARHARLGDLTNLQPASNELQRCSVKFTASLTFPSLPSIRGAGCTFTRLPITASTSSGEA